MTSDPELYSYRGKLARDMTRDELVVALAEQARTMDRLFQQHREDLEYFATLPLPRPRGILATLFGWGRR